MTPPAQTADIIGLFPLLGSIPLRSSPLFSPTTFSPVPRYAFKIFDPLCPFFQEWIGGKDVRGEMGKKILGGEGGRGGTDLRGEKILGGERGAQILVGKKVEKIFRGEREEKILGGGALPPFPP